MFSKHSSLFEQNPDVTAVYDMGQQTIGRLGHWGYRVSVPQYASYDPLTDRDINFPAHFIETMCRIATITGEIELRPYLFLSPSEKGKGRLHPKQAVIQSAGRASMRNKQWLPERYQAVVDALRDEVHWIQLGMANDPFMAGAVDLRGRTSLRESAAIIANSEVYVGEAGFLMHMARATDTRSVIVYGGREEPAISGYRVNENIVGKTICSPCWQRTRCDYGHECMVIIEPAEVIAAIKRQLELAGSPIEPERVTLETTAAL
jgi:hypothetical protein